MIVKLSPTDESKRVWVVSTVKDQQAIPVDYTRVSEEQRSFLGEGSGYYDAEPDADGWRIRGRVAPQAW